MKRAVIYARVSSKRQADDGISMDAQIDQCTNRAVQLGAAVVRVFRDDGVSGRSTKGRHGFASAMDYCMVGSVDFFIAWSTSRFARNAIDLWVHQDQLKEAGTRLECLNADIDDDTDSGFINRVFMGAMDQMVSRQIGRDTLKSLKQSAADGYFTGGHMPFGYVGVAEGKRTRLQVHAEHSAIVLRAFDLCLNEGLGAQAIALRLNTSGLTRDGSAWGKNSVHYLLKNSVYTGVKTFNRKSRKTGKEKPREEWVQVASHPALVSKDDFEKVQQMIELRTPHQHGGTPRSCFVFTSMLACGVCGNLLQITNGTSQNGTLYNYYGCMAHKKGAARCIFKKMRAEQFDDWLLAGILDKVMTPAVVAQALAEVAQIGAGWAKDRETRRALLVKKVRDMEGRRAKLYEVIELEGAALSDLSHISEQIRKRSDELQLLHLELAQLESEARPGKLPAIDPAIALEVMREVVQSGDAKKKRAFLGAFIQKVTVTLTQAIVDYKPDALVSVGHDLSVRNGRKWLPVNASIRTKRVHLHRPLDLKRGDSRVTLLTLLG